MSELSKATPHEQLIKELMDSRLPHSEHEWAAQRAIRKLRKESEYRHRAMCYFARQIDDYLHAAKPPDMISDIIGFWDTARERAAQESGFTALTGDLFHDWDKKPAN
jgi:hypothetical protein